MLYLCLLLFTEQISNLISIISPFISSNLTIQSLKLVFIQSVKDVSSHFVKVEVDRQCIDVDEDANQFDNIEDNDKYLIFRKWINL